MSNKCLVTTLSEAVTDTNLLKLDEIRFGYESSRVIGLDLHIVAGAPPLTLTLEGDIYFTNSSGTENYGKTKTLQLNWGTTYISPGKGTITSNHKDTIWTITAEATYYNFLEFDLSDIKYLSSLRWVSLNGTKKITGNLESIKDSTSIVRFCLTDGPVEGDIANLENIAPGLEYCFFSYCPKVYGDIDVFRNSTSLSDLWLEGTGVTGNLSSLAGCTNLGSLHLQDTAVTGDTSDLAGLTNLTTFIFTNTAITGTWPLV